MHEQIPDSGRPNDYGTKVEVSWIEDYGSSEIYKCHVILLDY